MRSLEVASPNIPRKSDARSYERVVALKYGVFLSSSMCLQGHAGQKNQGQLFFLEALLDSILLLLVADTFWKPWLA
jgi:hypothetical protein